MSTSTASGAARHGPDSDGVVRLRAVFVVHLLLRAVPCRSRVIRDQDRHKAGGAAELLLQRNLEITEMKSSEARTIAATRTDVFKDGAGGISLKAEGSHVPVVRSIGDETAQEKDGDGCTLQ